MQHKAHKRPSFFIVPKGLKMANLPPTLDIARLTEIPTTINGVPQEATRSHQILEFLICLLEAGTPADVTLSLTRSLRRLPEKEVNQ
jgi:hypothetical protein